jgi:glycosyltransferase involved in cell wall biosynthesis
MRIVIDLQGAQAFNPQTTKMGCFILELVKSMVLNRKEHEIILALNGLFKDTILPIRDLFGELLPKNNIRLWHAVPPVSSSSTRNDWRRRTAELTREAFLTHLKPDLVLISHFFAGSHDNAVTSIGLLNEKIPTAVLLYDWLFFNSKNPSEDSKMEAWYKDKLSQLGRSNLFLVMCENLQQESSLDFPLPTERRINIPKFPVDNCAQQTISAIESWHGAQKNKVEKMPTCRPKLAYVSPLPPARSGISFYSAELLPSLNQYYDIEVVVAQPNISDPWIRANCLVRTVEWFETFGAQYYERVLYHLGNSPFHSHMLDLFEKIPGVVVLHDFYVADVLNYRDAYSDIKKFPMELYYSHGYKALQEFLLEKNVENIVAKYPANLSILQKARGVIVHSEYCKQLAEQFYGSHETAIHWAIIPLLKNPVPVINRAKARKKLNFKADHFIVCSFGMMGQPKQSHRLLEAWLASSLSQHENNLLIFVGETTPPDYEQQLRKLINSGKLKAQIQITGWVDTKTFHHYLAAADVAVQLRRHSRGETSAAVLDCMNYGIATIINANGSLAALPQDKVWKLADDFTNSELAHALETLKEDSSLRRQLGERAKDFIKINHAPTYCAQQYFTAIEESYCRNLAGFSSLIKAISQAPYQMATKKELINLAQAWEKSIPPSLYQRQLFLDISILVQADFKTGIQRVIRAILYEWLNKPPHDFRVEPIYSLDGNGYRYARRFTLSFLGCPTDLSIDEPIEYHSGDVFLSLDLAYQTVTNNKNFYQELRKQGVKVMFLVYDLLPLQFPSFFPPAIMGSHQEWLETVLQNDAAICISQTVAEDLKKWIDNYHLTKIHAFNIAWFHLGADIENSVPTVGLPPDAHSILNQVESANSFLMVGTIEPRKGHAQTLAAFEELWAKQNNVILVIIGKRGWMMESFLGKLSSHPELGKRLIWLEGASDEFMEKIYKASTCLIAASEGEGFGLPLIEAAQHKLPILARDIPVFREVAKEQAYYFKGTSPKELVEAIEQWLCLYRAGLAPPSDSIPWITWEQSTNQLARTLF